jgi:hypothetical protein
MVNDDSSYSFEIDDFLECVTFAYNYHMFEGKGARGRTNQGKRGFGGELDAFVPGKLCEIAVTKILEKYSNSSKKLHIDNDVYPDSDNRVKSDPDIVKVGENGILRKPKLFIEVKRISPSDKMVGIRKSQLDESVKKWQGDIVGDDKIFIVHAELFYNEENKKSNDITGSILKNLTKNNDYKFDKFSNHSSLRCKINHIYTIKELKKYGRIFPQGEIIPKIMFYEKDELKNTNGHYRLRSTGKLRKNHIIVKNFEGINTLKPYIKGSDMKIDYGECEFYGKFNLIEPKNNKNNRQIIECLTDVKVKNNFFGEYILPKGNEFLFNVENSLGGINKTKGIDDLWMSITKLKQLNNNKAIKSPNDLLKHISINI